MLMCRYLNKNSLSNFFPLVRTLQQNTLSRYSTKANPPLEEENNEPIRFLNSGAAKWRAKQSRSGISEDVLWYQPYVVIGSVAVFLIYFCILREESNIDMELERTLYSRIEGLEETQLLLSYKYNKEHGKDVTDIEKRMTELGMAVNNS